MYGDSVHVYFCIIMHLQTHDSMKDKATHKTPRWTHSSMDASFSWSPPTASRTEEWRSGVRTSDCDIRMASRSLYNYRETEKMWP